MFLKHLHHFQNFVKILLFHWAYLHATRSFGLTFLQYSPSTGKKQIRISGAESGGIAIFRAVTPSPLGKVARR